MKPSTFLVCVVLTGCAPSQEDRLLACLQEAKFKEAALFCKQSFGVKHEEQEARPTEPRQEMLDAASLELKWVNPYMGSTLSDGSASQACLRAFDLYWARKEWDKNNDSDDDKLFRIFDRPDLRGACYVKREVLAECRYCDEFRIQDQEKRAEIERLRSAATNTE